MNIGQRHVCVAMLRKHAQTQMQFVLSHSHSHWHRNMYATPTYTSAAIETHAVLPRPAGGNDNSAQQ